MNGRLSIEWGVRIALAMTAAALGISSVAATLGFLIKETAPALAHDLAPWDGRITAQLAKKRLADTLPRPSMPASQLAQRALEQDPTAVAAVTTLGTLSQLRNETGQARRLFLYAQVLSRRDLQAQLWAIQDAVANADVSGALHHYDIALRTSAGAPDILFPILVTAIAESPVRSALRKMLATRPPWAGLFIEYSSMNGPDPRATALLFRDLDQTGNPIPELPRELLTDKLASQGFFENAWAYYTSFRTNASRQRSRDPRFTANLSNPTIFDWQSVATDGLSASVQNGLIDFAVPSSIGGMLVRQLQLLPPGDYRLSGHSIAINLPVDSLPFWSLTCSDGREFGRVVMSNSAEAGGNFEGQISVPSNCMAQTLGLVARPSDGVSGTSGQVDRVQLMPINDNSKRDL